MDVLTMCSFGACRYRSRLRDFRAPRSEEKGGACGQVLTYVAPQARVCSRVYCFLWARQCGLGSSPPRTAKHGQDCYHNLRRATGRVGAGATDKIVTAIYAVDPAAPGINFDARE